jgi:hypothetical protein
MRVEHKKRKAITLALAEKLNETYHDNLLVGIERRKAIEARFKVELFIEPHAISAWTPRTAIVTWYA